MVDITLPAPIILPIPAMVVMHWMLLSLDFLLLRNEHCIPLTKTQLRTALALCHALVPVIIVSPSITANLFLATLPWFYAAYTASLPLEKYSYREWLESFNYVVLDMPDSAVKIPNHVRLKGIARVGRGVVKLIIMKLCIDRLLPQNDAAILRLSWYCPESVFSTLLLGTKAYCFLGVADIGMGIQQAITDLPLVDLFDSPFLATG
ncbi:hypothetical protein BX666DRAFT_1849617 [Dichotomocladium elegans]|nr:hypothetical protein BX666DRAFT_1849617 [Dichotomocladium elegans]